MVASQLTAGRHWKLLDLTGMKFGLWLVLGRADHHDKLHVYWSCRCDCGTERVVPSGRLRTSDSKSCGCARAEISRRQFTTHGHGRSLGTTRHGKPSPTYVSWTLAKSRCHNPTCPHFWRYGGRGIQMCEQWRSSFPQFMADMGERPSGTTLDRINNDGHYEPGNCRWATPATQNRHQARFTPITWQGKTMLAVEWAESLGWPKRTINCRLDRGWPLERIFAEPPRRRNRTT